MTNFYLLRPDGSFSDAADYPSIPDARGDGQWVQGTPDGYSPYRYMSLDERLTALFLQGKEQLGDSVPDEVRGQLYILQAGVLGALTANDPTAAKALIETAALPPSPEMEAIRAAMISLFES